MVEFVRWDPVDGDIDGWVDNGGCLDWMPPNTCPEAEDVDEIGVGF